MSSDASIVLRDILQNNQRVDVGPDRTLTLAGTKYPFNSPTPFAGINLFSLYVHCKFKGNRKEINNYCQRLTPAAQATQPKGALVKQIDAWFKSTDNKPPLVASQSNPQTTSNKQQNNTANFSSAANHHFSFGDDNKVDPSLAAFDIRLSSGAPSNTSSNSYSYSIPSPSETRSYAPPAESQSFSYSIADSGDVISSSSRNYSIPTAQPASGSDRYGVPASAAMDTSDSVSTWNQSQSQSREERKPRNQREDRDQDRRQDRRGDRGPRGPRGQDRGDRDDRRDRDRDSDRNRQRSRSRSREREPTAVPRAVSANYSSWRTDIKSSLVVAPPKEFWGPIVEIKKNHMNPRIKRPPYPHITLLAPFLGFSLLPDARTVLREKLATIQPFKIELNQFQIFYNKTSFTLYLSPTVTPAGSLERLYKACLEVFPQCTKGGFEAHIGVGYFHSRREAEMYLQRYQYGWKPFSWTVQEIYMMGRISETDPFEVRQAVPLGGVDPVPLIKPVPF